MEEWGRGLPDALSPRCCVAQVLDAINQRGPSSRLYSYVLGLIFYLHAWCGLIQYAPYYNSSLLLFWPYPSPTLCIIWAFNILDQKADKDTDSAPRKNPAWIYVKHKKYDICNWSKNITSVIFQRLFGRSIFAGQILNVVSNLKHLTARIHYFPYVHFILQSKLYCPSAPITILLPIRHSSPFIDTLIWLHASCSQ